MAVPHVVLNFVMEVPRGVNDLGLGVVLDPRKDPVPVKAGIDLDWDGIFRDAP